MEGTTVRSAGKLITLTAVALLGAGIFLAGCKSAPPLTADQAQAMIQAKYDQTAPTGITISVTDLGMRQGIAAKYWTRTTIYPNHYWADFTLTPDGKKVVALPGGGDVIQWRPQGLSDTKYAYMITTVQANHLRALNVRNIQSETLPGASQAMGADYDEGIDFTGVPGPLVDIAHNPGNQLSTQHHADFALVSGAWKLQSIE